MSIIDHVKDVAELVKKHNDMPLYEKILELREEILELREQNLELSQKVQDFEASAVIETDLIRSGNCYYRKSDTEKEHPYCLTCWDADRKLVSLLKSRPRSGGGFNINCGICNARMGRKSD